MIRCPILAIPLTRRNKPPPPRTSPPSAPRPTTTRRAAAQSTPRRPLRTTDHRSAHAARNSDHTRAIDEERSASTESELPLRQALRFLLRPGESLSRSAMRLTLGPRSVKFKRFATMILLKLKLFEYF
jgi:hypothetical protein